jgi:hypothetical protein
MRRLATMKICTATACGVLALALVAPAGMAAKRGGGTQVVCVDAKSLHREYKKRPKRCVFHRRHEPIAEAFFVRTKHDHWHTWTHRQARGRGREVPPMGHSTTPVRIKLSDPVRRCGHRVFSKAHFFFPKTGHGTTMKVDTCA